MGSKYEHLSEEERVTIYHWHASGKSACWIGARLGRHRSTITRELRRNSRKSRAWPGGYDPLRAQSLADRRRRWDGRFKLARQPRLRRLVRDRLAMGWSPEQIAAGLAQTQSAMSISHESIYRFIYHRTAQKDWWHRLLPRRKHRRGRRVRRGGRRAEPIKARVSIEERPRAAARRKQPGHWEADTLLFRRHGQSVLVAQERASRYILLAKPKNRTAGRIAAKLAAWLRPLPPPLRRSLTQDNGTEFALHHKLRDRLGLKTFFCAPHAPWQKGGIENLNGRLRRHLPRKTDLDTVSTPRLRAIAHRLNHTPRKCLGFKTPAQVFSRFLLSVALHS